jgi:hypothetical protein
VTYLAAIIHSEGKNTHSSRAEALCLFGGVVPCSVLMGGGLLYTRSTERQIRAILSSTWGSCSDAVYKYGK